MGDASGGVVSAENWKFSPPYADKACSGTPSRHLRLALGGRDTVPADIAFTGDSISAGYTVDKAVTRRGYRVFGISAAATR